MMTEIWNFPIGSKSRSLSAWKLKMNGICTANDRIMTAAEALSVPIQILTYNYCALFENKRLNHKR